MYSEDFLKYLAFASRGLPTVFSQEIDYFTILSRLSETILKLSEQVDTNTSNITNNSNSINQIKSDLADLERFVKTIVNNRVFFESVADMVAADLGVDTICFTNNYYSDEDGGGAMYYISNTIEPNTYSAIALDNGNVAVLMSPWTVRRMGGRNGMDITDIWFFIMRNAPRTVDIDCEYGNYLARYITVYGYDRIIDFHGSNFTQIPDPAEYHGGIFLNVTTGAEFRKNLYIKNLNVDLSNMHYQEPIGARPFNINTQTSNEGNGKIDNLHYQNIHVTGGINNDEINHVWFINADNGKENLTNIYLENCSWDLNQNGGVYIIRAGDVHMIDCTFAGAENAVNQTVSGTDCNFIEMINCTGVMSGGVTGSGATIHVTNADVLIDNCDFTGKAIYNVIKSEAGTMRINNSKITAVQRAVEVDTSSDITLFISNSDISAQNAIFASPNITPAIYVSNTVLTGAVNTANGAKVFGADGLKRRFIIIPTTATANTDITVTATNLDVTSGTTVSIPYNQCYIFGVITNNTGTPTTFKMFDADNDTQIAQTILTAASGSFVSLLTTPTNIKFQFTTEYNSATVSALYVIPLN